MRASNYYLDAHCDKSLSCLQRKRFAISINFCIVFSYLRYKVYRNVRNTKQSTLTRITSVVNYSENTIQMILFYVFFLIAKQVRYLHKHLSTCVKCQEILTIDTCLVDLTFSDRFLCLSVVKLVFHKFVRANIEKSNLLIGWRQPLTTSRPNHIHFLLVRAFCTSCCLAFPSTCNMKLNALKNQCYEAFVVRKIVT
jgi:hypothetical protein